MYDALIKTVTSTVFVAEGWWGKIPPELQLLFAFINFLLNLVVISGFLYIAGRLVVGGKRATYTDAFVIALLGTLFESACFLFVPWPFIALLLSIVFWLAMIKNFYETGWLGAVAVAVLAVLAFIIISLIVAVALKITEIILERWLPLILAMFRG